MPELSRETSRSPTSPTKRARCVNGGDALYLCHWMRASGLAALLPSLARTVWFGLSAGSMVTTPRVGEEFVEETAIAVVDRVTTVVSEGHWKFFAR
jgi:hypothetical protein